MNRREFIGILAAASAAGMLPGCSKKTAVSNTAALSQTTYELPSFGNARLLHFTDCHAKLMPIYFREPNVNLGLASAFGRPPHLVGQKLLDYLQLKPNTREAHAFTYLNFADAAEQYGKVGGFAHLKTLVDQLRGEVSHSLLLDGGDTWQGSATSYWTRGKDMVNACNLLGVDIMTGHWEFTYRDDEVLANIEAFNGEFLAQNVKVTEDALFDDAPAYDADTGHAFKPYTIKQMGEHRVAVIGQAFPYTPIANPSRFIPDWTFGIQEQALQELVDEIKANEKPQAIILLSHNGMDVDIKLASKVSGLDVILGGHTHDGIPVPIVVKNNGGTTHVTNAGSNGKFLAVLDLQLNAQGVSDIRYKLLPVFSNILKADADMLEHITTMRQPYLDKLQEPLAIAGTALYRRGNFNGSFDQVICDALRNQLDAQVALSPGFRWGTSVLPGQTITMEHVMDQTAITYPETYARNMKGSELKLILEDVADNLFHEDPYRQQGGDMVRVGGLEYTCDPKTDSGSRIQELRLDNGELIDANKEYKVAGWATVGSKSPGPNIWDVVADHLRDQKTVNVDKLNTPKLLGMQKNPGIADYQGELG